MTCSLGRGWCQHRFRPPSMPTCPLLAPPPAGAEAAPSPLRLHSLSSCPTGCPASHEALCWPLNLAPSTTERVPLSGPSLSVQLRASSHSRPPAHPPHSHLPAPPPCAHLQLRPLPSAVSCCPPNSPLPACPHRWTPW